MNQLLFVSFVFLSAACGAKPSYLVIETQFMGRKDFSVEVPFEEFRYLESVEVNPFSVSLTLALKKALKACEDLGIGIRNPQLVEVMYRLAKGYGRKDVFLVVGFRDSESASRGIVVFTSDGDILDGCFYNADVDEIVRY